MLSYNDVIRNLERLKDVVLNRHRLKEGVLYKYMPFNSFISMCKSALKKIESGEKFAPLDLFCFDAETYNDPQEGKILIELSDDEECLNEKRRLLAQIYKDTEKHKNIVDINSLVFVGSFIFESKKHPSEREDFRGDVLPMWRDYANKGKGVCLGVTLDAGLDIPIYKISYDRKEHLKVLDEICELLSYIPQNKIEQLSSRIRAIIDPVRFLFKSPEHDYENEARIIEICSLSKTKGRSFFYSKDTKKYRYNIKLFEKQDNPALSRLYIVFDNFFFKKQGQIIVGPGFEESDYLFGKRVVIKQIYYWLERLNLIDRVEVKASKINIRF